MKRVLYFLFLIFTHVLGVDGGRDFYKILGIKRNANSKQIKTAHRALVKKWHPDKNPDNPEFAQNKFLEISEAFEVLNDPEKKQKYDRCGEACLSENEPIRSEYRSHPFANMRQVKRTVYPSHFDEVQSSGRGGLYNAVKAELHGGDTLETQIGEGWPTLLYVFNGDKFNKEAHEMVKTIKNQTAMKALSVALYSFKASPFGLVRESQIDGVRQIFQGHSQFQEALNRVDTDTDFHRWAILTMEKSELKVVSISSPHTNLDKLKSWIRKYIPQPLKKIRSEIDLNRFIKSYSDKPKIIILDKTNDIELSRQAYTHKYGDYAIIKMDKHKLPKKLVSVLPSPSKSMYSAFHIYDKTIVQYSKGKGIETIDSKDLSSLFTVAARDVAKQKMKGTGMYSAVGDVSWLNKSSEAAAYCDHKDRHICIVHVGHEPSSDFKNYARQYSKEKSVRFATVEKNHISHIIPDLKEHSYFAVKPKLQIYKIKEEGQNIGEFVGNMIDFGFTSSSSGAKTMDAKFIIDENNSY